MPLDTVNTVLFVSIGMIDKLVKGLKIPRWKYRAGSIPAPGTI